MKLLWIDGKILKGWEDKLKYLWKDLQLFFKVVFVYEKNAAFVSAIMYALQLLIIYTANYQAYNSAEKNTCEVQKR